MLLKCCYNIVSLFIGTSLRNADVHQTANVPIPNAVGGLACYRKSCRFVLYWRTEDNRDLVPQPKHLNNRQRGTQITDRLQF